MNLSRVTEGFFEEGFEIVGTTCLLIAFTEYFLHRQPADAAPSKTKKRAAVSR
jgi:hypothetical protein